MTAAVIWLIAGLGARSRPKCVSGEFVLLMLGGGALAAAGASALVGRRPAGQRGACSRSPRCCCCSRLRPALRRRLDRQRPARRRTRTEALVGGTAYGASPGSTGTAAGSGSAATSGRRGRSTGHEVIEPGEPRSPSMRHLRGDGPGRSPHHPLTRRQQEKEGPRGRKHRSARRRRCCSCCSSSSRWSRRCRSSRRPGRGDRAARPLPAARLTPGLAFLVPFIDRIRGADRPARAGRVVPAAAGDHPGQPDGEHRHRRLLPGHRPQGRGLRDLRLHRRRRADHDHDAAQRGRRDEPGGHADLPRRDQRQAARRAGRGHRRLGHPGRPGGDQGHRPAARRSRSRWSGR